MTENHEYKNFNELEIIPLQKHHFKVMMVSKTLTRSSLLIKSKQLFADFVIVAVVLQVLLSEIGS